MAAKIKKFKALIESGPMGGAYITIPFDVEKEYGQKRPKIKATFDGVLYRGSLARYGSAEHILIIRKDIRAQINKQVGEEVKITLEKDLEPRKVEISADLQEALQTEPAVADFFKALSYTHQKEYVQWIEGAKRQETRERRIKKAIEMMKNGKKGV